MAGAFALAFLFFRSAKRYIQGMKTLSHRPAERPPSRAVANNVSAAPVQRAHRKYQNVIRYGRGYLQDMIAISQVDKPEVPVEKEEKKEQKTLRHKKQGQRLHVEISDAGDRKALGMKGNKKFKDLTYREHTQLLNREYEAHALKRSKTEEEPKEKDTPREGPPFLENAEIYDSFNAEAAKGRVSHASPPKKITNSNKNTGSLILNDVSTPQASTLPVRAQQYGGMHYTPVLQNPDDTATTRAYEHEYVGEAYKRLDFGAVTALNLPPQEQTPHMIDTLGAGLDFNTATSSKTLGSGIAYKLVYKDFQRTMELINSSMDAEIAHAVAEAKKLVPDGVEIDEARLAFNIRTYYHNRQLQERHLEGIVANEKKQNPETDVPALEQNVETVSDKLEQLLKSKDEGQVKEYLAPLVVSPKTTLDTYRMIRRVLALKIKVVKRLLLNKGMLKEPVNPELKRMVRLSWLEDQMNEVLKDTIGDFDSLESKEYTSNQLGKELEDLKGW